MLHEGRNAIGTVLGDGWFRGRIGFAAGRRNIYGEHLASLAQLEIQYADGPSERNIPLRQSLHMLPNYDDAVRIINDELQLIK